MNRQQGNRSHVRVSDIVQERLRGLSAWKVMGWLQDTKAGESACTFPGQDPEGAKG